MAGAVEHGFPYSRANSALLRGWALAAQGSHAEGLAQMQQGLAASRTIGIRLPLSYWLGLLAEEYGYAGRLAEELVLLAEALAVVDDTGQRFYAAELYRVYALVRLCRNRHNFSHASQPIWAWRKILAKRSRPISP